MLKTMSLITILKIIDALIGLSIMIFITRFYPPESMALYALYFTIQSALTIFTLPGLNIILMRQLIAHNYSLIEGIQKISLKYSLYFMAILLAVLMILKQMSFLDANHFYVVLFATLAIPISSFNKYPAIFNFSENFNLVMAQSFSFSVFFSLLCLSNLWWNLAIEVIIVFHLLAQIMMTIVGHQLYRKLKSKSPEKYLNQLGLSKVELKEGIKLSSIYFFESLSSTFDRFILYYLNPVSLANWQVGSQLANKLKDYSKIPLEVPMTTFLRLGHRNFKSTIKNLVLPFLTIFFILTMGLYWGAPYYIPLFFGENYRSAIPLAQLMAIVFGIKFCLYLFETKEMAYRESTFYRFLFIGRKIFYVVMIVALIKQKFELALAIALIYSEGLILLIYLGRYLYNVFTRKQLKKS
jgi:O-antigen/teichoic acid export membrane protein